LQVFFNGDWIEEKDVKISFFDRGVLYGESVYEVLRTYKRQIFSFEQHYKRLINSASEMNIPIFYTAEELVEIIKKGIEINTSKEAYIRIQFSSAVDYVSFGKQPGNCIILVKEMPEVNREIYIKGVIVDFSLIRRRVPNIMGKTIKTTAALDVFLARGKRDSAVYDSLMINSEGYLAEGTFSNIFLVKEGKISTPSLDSGILHGVTRENALKIIRRMGIEIEERLINVFELFFCDEVFLTHTSAGVVPVSKIGRNLFEVGKVTKEIIQSFERFCEKPEY